MALARHPTRNIFCLILLNFGFTTRGVDDGDNVMNDKIVVQTKNLSFFKVKKMISITLGSLPQYPLPIVHMLIIVIVQVEDKILFCIFEMKIHHLTKIHQEEKEH